MPDLECRDAIRIGGRSQKGDDWIGIMGNAIGTFRAPFLGIPATGRPAHMRYHEFYRFEADALVEMHAVWDIPELMIQANAWPMAPALGREWRAPGLPPATACGTSPARGDHRRLGPAGLRHAGTDEELSGHGRPRDDGA